MGALGEFVDWHVRMFDSSSALNYGTYNGLGELLAAWLGIIVMFWMLGLAALVWKAAPDRMENRFISVLLGFEGLRCAWMGPSVFPLYGFWEPITVELYELFRATIFQYATLVSALMFLCFPIFFRVPKMGFMHKEKFQRHAWYMPALIAALYFVPQYLRGASAHRLSNVYIYRCTGKGAEPQVIPYDTLTADAATGPTYLLEGYGGICHGEFHWLYRFGGSAEMALTALTLMLSLFALYILRRSRIESEKQGELDASESLTTRSLYIGFVGKVLGFGVFGLFLFVLMPMLNPLDTGLHIFDDFSLVLLDENRSLRGTLFIYASIITYFLMSLPLAFEGMMFVHAMTKGTVLGIDRQLRRTFSLAVLTGLGTMLFIIGCEVVEALLPLPGIAGGVFLSGGVILVRRPILAIVDGFSGKLLPSEYAPEEVSYLEAFSEVMDDGVVSPKERILLTTLAKTMGITDARVAEIEAAFTNSSIADDESE